MAELADARDLKSLDRNVIRVQIPSPAPFMISAMMYEETLIKQLSENAERAGSIPLTEDVLKRLDTWEMTPQEEFDEAVYFYENFNIELPEEFEEEYRRRYL